MPQIPNPWPKPQAPPRPKATATPDTFSNSFIACVAKPSKLFQSTYRFHRVHRVVRTTKPLWGLWRSWRMSSGSRRSRGTCCGLASFRAHRFCRVLHVLLSNSIVNHSPGSRMKRFRVYSGRHYVDDSSVQSLLRKHCMPIGH